MSETRTREIVVRCRDVNVAVTYAHGLGMVNPPTAVVCQGYGVIFDFAGPPGTADIIPKDPADASWLEKLGISVPGREHVDTGPATPGVDYHYTIVINARDPDGAAFSVTIDPILRPL